jgi:dTDP-4-dehydrorhamnose reductase
MDLASEKWIRDFWKTQNLNIVVNCVAHTAVDKAEEHKALAHKIDSEAVARFANLCRKNDSRLLHTSTDYVFNGRGNTPLFETAATNPLSVYAESEDEDHASVIWN